MNNDWNRNNILFHNRANEVMHTLFSEFEASIATINRQHDENVFQQQLGKYSRLLKHQLDFIALEVIGQAGSNQNTSEKNHALSLFIEEYLHEFKQKAKSL